MEPRHRAHDPRKTAPNRAVGHQTSWNRNVRFTTCMYVENCYKPHRRSAIGTQQRRVHYIEYIEEQVAGAPPPCGRKQGILGTLTNEAHYHTTSFWGEAGHAVLCCV